jgi:hypothetical protein
MARFLQGSRYTNGVVSTNRDGNQFLILRNILSLAPSENDSFVTVTNEMISRPDILSYVAYQRPDLWWAILDVNGIKNVFSLQVNQKLRVPQLSDILSAINTLNNNL